MRFTDGSLGLAMSASCGPYREPWLNGVDAEARLPGSRAYDMRVSSQIAGCQGREPVFCFPWSRRFGAISPRRARPWCAGAAAKRRGRYTMRTDKHARIESVLDARVRELGCRFRSPPLDRRLGRLAVPIAPSAFVETVRKRSPGTVPPRCRHWPAAFAHLHDPNSATTS